MMFAAAFFSALLISSSFAARDLQKQNELIDTPEDKANILMGEIEGHCKAISDRNTGKLPSSYQLFCAIAILYNFIFIS